MRQDSILIETTWKGVKRRITAAQKQTELPNNVSEMIEEMIFFFLQGT